MDEQPNMVTSYTNICRLALETTIISHGICCQGAPPPIPGFRKSRKSGTSRKVEQVETF